MNRGRFTVTGAEQEVDGVVVGRRDRCDRKQGRDELKVDETQTRGTEADTPCAMNVASGNKPGVSVQRERPWDLSWVYQGI
jgi:hypothetical protein